MTNDNCSYCARPATRSDGFCDQCRAPEGLDAIDIQVRPGEVELGYDMGRYHDGGCTRFSPEAAIELARQLTEAAIQAAPAEVQTAFALLTNTSPAGVDVDKLIAMGPHGSIQWKGTSVCMDVRCACGEYHHIDEDFAYVVHCPVNGKNYNVSEYVQLTETTADATVIMKHECQECGQDYSDHMSWCKTGKK